MTVAQPAKKSRIRTSRASSPRFGGVYSLGGGWWALVFALPAIVLLGVFFLYPVMAIAIHAFTTWDGFSPPTYVGLANFAQLLQDPDFWTALRNNFLYAAFVPIQVLFSLVLAMLVYEHPPGWRLARAVFFLPVIMSPIVVGILWGSILGLNGAFNQILSSVGLGSIAQAWLASPQTAIPAIMIVVLWASFGFNVTLLLAALSALSPALIDAAHVDGANWWTTLRHIVIPSLRHSIELVAVLNLITAFAFMLPYTYVLTGGGPGRETYVVEYLIYDEGFTFGRLGYASALSLVLFSIVSLLMLAYLRIVRRADA